MSEDRKSWWKNPPRWMELTLTLVIAIFAVIGPVKEERLNRVPAALGLVLGILQEYRYYIAVGLFLLLVYWTRPYILRGLIWAKEWLYMRPLVFVIRPAVHRIIQSPAPASESRPLINGFGQPAEIESHPSATSQGRVPRWSRIGSWEVPENESGRWEFGADWIRGKEEGTVLWHEPLPAICKVRFEARLVEDHGSDEIDVIIGGSMILYYSQGVRLDLMTDDLARERHKNLVAHPSPVVGRWYKFLIARSRDLCTLMIDEKQVITFPSDTERTVFSGRLGFAHWRNRIEFRSLQIEKVQ